MHDTIYFSGVRNRAGDVAANMMNRTLWTRGQESHSGLPSPPALAGNGDSQSFFSPGQKPDSTDNEEQAFLPSKVGYLHMKNQVMANPPCTSYSASCPIDVGVDVDVDVGIDPFTI